MIEDRDVLWEHQCLYTVCQDINVINQEMYNGVSQMLIKDAFHPYYPVKGEFAYMMC